MKAKSFLGRNFSCNQIPFKGSWITVKNIVHSGEGTDAGKNHLYQFSINNVGISEEK